MKDKIEKYLREHKVATKAEIMAEFLISHAELMPYLYELADEGKIEQKGDNGIRYIVSSYSLSSDTESTNAKGEHIDLEDIFAEGGENKDDTEIQELFGEYKDRLKKFTFDDIDEDDKSIVSNGEEGEEEEPEEDGDDNLSPDEQLLQKKKREKALIDELLVKDFNINMSDNEQFESAVMDIIEAVTAVDSGNTRRDAIRICKELLRRARRNRRRPLFERAHKEFSIATDDEYEMLRKQIFGE